jgi:molybdopterin/thiamine biosynthesis adenylyltransferase/nitroreductase
VSPIPSEPDAYRPVLFPDDEPLNSPGWAAVHADPGTLVLDHRSELAGQVDGLITAPTAAESAEALRWVYYPWRRTLVTVPGPALFRRIRLDRNRYQITSVEQRSFGRIRIGVAGLSVGHSIAHTLAMEGLCGFLRLADFDRLELSNLNRLPATVLDLGVNKAVIAARRIAELDPYLPVEVDPRGVMTDSVAEFVDGLDIVVDECDSLDIKVLLRLAARERGIPVIMATSDRGLLDIERFDLDGNREIFHGLLGPVDPTVLAGLPARDKAPFVMRILEADKLSARLAASLVETDRTLSSWPQLAGEVTLGAASVAAAVRRLVRGQWLPSGRTRIDLDEQLVDLQPPPLGEDSLEPIPADPVASASAAGPLDAMADAMRLAPSGGNSQPWLVTRYRDRLEVAVRPDETTAMDVRFRGTCVAIGAATFNARVAAARYSVGGSFDVVDDPATGLPRVIVKLGETGSELADYYDPMLDRMSNRTPGVRQEFDAGTLRALRDAVAAEGARLIMVTDPERLSAIGQVLSASDRLRYLTPTLHEQMIGELKWPGRDPLDRGIDVRTLSLDATDLVKLQVSARSDVMELLADWNVGAALGEHTRDRVRDASGLAVISVHGTALADYVLGGMATERFWVVATAFGLGVYPISPVFLYARTEHDLTTLAPKYAQELGRLQHRFRTILGIDTNDAQILVLRVAHRPGPAVRSGRVSRRTNVLVRMD